MAQAVLGTVTDMENVTYKGNSHLHLPRSFKLPLSILQLKGTECGLWNLLNHLPPPAFLFGGFLFRWGFFWGGGWGVGVAFWFLFVFYIYTHTGVGIFSQLR